jgi:phage replication-related protein YjqB (UPF0714/DUF867 family)
MSNSIDRRRSNKYHSYAELALHELQGRDYCTKARHRTNSQILIVAPHGGLIEVGTSEIAYLVAGDEYNLFSFEGLKPYGANRDLHITSHQFDHPDCLAMAARCGIVVTVHGCLGASQIHVGGLDVDLAARLARQLCDAGFPAHAESARYPGRHPLNICNRGSRAKGAQLEISYELRTGESRAGIAQAVRTAIASYALI